MNKIPSTVKHCYSECKHPFFINSETRRDEFHSLFLSFLPLEPPEVHDVFLTDSAILALILKKTTPFSFFQDPDASFDFNDFDGDPMPRDQNPENW